MSVNLTPVFRNEQFMYAAINGTTPPTPVFNEEFYWAKIAGADVDLPAPFSRRDMFLAYLAGMEVDLPTPVTRDEIFLAHACGIEVDVPEPQFRDEFYLIDIAYKNDEDAQSDVVDVGRVDYMKVLT